MLSIALVKVGLVWLDAAAALRVLLSDQAKRCRPDPVAQRGISHPLNIIDTAWPRIASPKALGSDPWGKSPVKCHVNSPVKSPAG